MSQLPDNSAFDLQAGKVVVEVKTVFVSKHGKVTMNAKALMRKQIAIKEGRLKRVFTVIADKRQPGVTRYYMAKGVGSFRIPKADRDPRGRAVPTTILQIRGLIR